MIKDYPSRVEETWLQSLRSEKPSVLAQREDLNALRHRIEIALATREGAQRALKEGLEALGAGKLDQVAAYGGLAFAAVGTIGLLAEGRLPGWSPPVRQALPVVPLSRSSGGRQCGVTLKNWKGYRRNK